MRKLDCLNYLGVVISGPTRQPELSIRVSPSRSVPSIVSEALPAYKAL